MRLAIIGHSLIHPRQQNFYRLLAEQEGIEATLFSPGEWGEQRTYPLDEGNFHIRTLRHFGGEDQYRFHFIGLKDALLDGKFDVVYINQEPGSIVAYDVASWREELKAKLAIFTWENIFEHFTPFAQNVLASYDLVVCGNDEAEKYAKLYGKRTVILPQVGVDTDHFQARPVERNISVAYIGRNVPEKGVDELRLAWPTVRVLNWQPYLQLPWWYSQVQIVACFSQDTPYWKEQAMPYVAVEAMCCGCSVIVSDAGSIPFWLGMCPGIKIVGQNNVAELQNQIKYLLANPEVREDMATLGRKWVEENLSSRVIAKKLAEALGNV